MQEISPEDSGCDAARAVRCGGHSMRGHSVCDDGSGLDISDGLLAVARERLPEADLREGDMETLPFADDAFDAVIGVNAFHALSDRLEETLRAAGLELTDQGEVECVWQCPDVDEGVRALLCSAGGARAKEEAGEAAVRAALEPVLRQYALRFVNPFRWVAAR